ncbi:MAG: acylphosphatase [Candidatus Bathyarchaeia archaeon]
MVVRAHVLVSGRVQGVFFRFETRRLARRLGIAGWVRNRSDGQVEAVFEGEKEAVERMVEFCRHGPSGARVTNAEVRWEEPTGEFEGFNVRYSYQLRSAHSFKS